MPISLVLDIIIAVLLVLTIAYAVKLNQRLSQLRSDKKELQQLAKIFADATQRAEQGIQTLKISSEALQDQMKKADVLKDDLAYLVDRGSRTADEMVESASRSRPSAYSDGRADQGGATSASGASMSRQQSRGGSRAYPADNDPDTRLIEDAIRAATPQPSSQPGSRGVEPKGVEPKGVEPRGVEPRGIETRSSDNQAADVKGPQPRKWNPGQGAVDEAPANTRRISGRGTSGGTAPGGTGKSLASRGLDVAGGEDGMEDSQSARDLLKALSSVK